jgi:integrase
MSISMANLKLQGTIYHARLTVPKDVRDKFGNKVEMWRTTGTGNKRLAELRGAQIIVDWKREVLSARNGVDVTEWTKAWAKQIRSANTVPTDDDAVPGYKSPSEREASEHIMLEQLEDMVEERRFTVPQAKAAFEVAIGHRVILGDYRDDYMRQYRNHSIKTRAAYQAAVDRFVSHFPDNQQVSPKALKAWVTAMVDEEELAAKTVTRMINQARVFWSYLDEHEIVAEPSITAAFAQLKVPKTAKKQESVIPFSAAEVVSILRSPVAVEDPQLTLLIKIAMYTGARIEELAMLKRSDLDFKLEVMNFRGTKTKAAVRTVPMHPVLIPILSAIEGDDPYVIGGLNIDGRGERGKALGKRFGRLKTTMGFIPRKQVFHSIRATVATQLEQAHVGEGVAADIVGHEKKTMTYGLYSGGSSLEQKKDAIKRLVYPM